MIIKQKKILIIIIHLSYCLCLLSQPIKSLTIAPLGLINKVRLKYEKQAGESSSLSYGGYFNFYYGLYPCVRIDLFVRYYFFSEKLNGFYLIVKPGFGYFKTDLVYHYITDRNDTLEHKKQDYYFLTYGAGAGVGYQLNLVKNIILDSFITFNFFSFNPPKTLLVDNKPYKLTDQLWTITGPGAVINLHLGIGFKF